MHWLHLLHWRGIASWCDKFWFVQECLYWKFYTYRSALSVLFNICQLLTTNTNYTNWVDIFMYGWYNASFLGKSRFTDVRRPDNKNESFKNITNIEFNMRFKHIKIHWRMRFWSLSREIVLAYVSFVSLSTQCWTFDVDVRTELLIFFWCNLRSARFIVISLTTNKFLRFLMNDVESLLCDFLLDWCVVSKF